MDQFILLTSGYSINPAAISQIDFRAPTVYIHLASNVITCGEADSAMLREKFFPAADVAAAKADFAKTKKAADKAAAVKPAE